MINCLSVGISALAPLLRKCQSANRSENDVFETINSFKQISFRES